MISFGDYVDRTTPHKTYTDTDYDVFSEAAEHVLNGGSPYDRHTYRYTPLAAYMCIPCHLVTKLFGKYVFILCDVIMGVKMWQLIES
jgi:phosphatidylinositol glycan class M